MLRISWPLAIVAAVVIALVARNPRLFVPMTIVFLVWYLVQANRRSDR